jgi:hypothetical protein
MAACELAFGVIITGAAAAEAIPSLLNSVTKYHVFNEAEIVRENLRVLLVNYSDR